MGSWTLRRGLALTMAVLLLAVLVPAGVAEHTQTFPLIHEELAAAGSDHGDGFGAALALDGTTLAIGVPGDDAAGKYTGSVELFEHDPLDGWVRDARIALSSGQAFDFFGSAVALEGDLLAVGAWGEDVGWGEEGAVYVYQREEGVWGFETRLLAPDPQASARFGRAVAIDGDRIAVGEPFRKGVDFGEGAAYVFERDGGSWSLAGELLADQPRGNALVGSSVEIAGDTVVAGAPSDSEAAFLAGAVYVFEAQGAGWSQTQKLIPEAAGPWSKIGEALALNEDTLLVGWRNDDPAGAASGSVLVYERDDAGWTEATKLVAEDGTSLDLFGRAVALAGDVAMVGAATDEQGFPWAGSAYLFARGLDGWSQVDKLTDPSPSEEAEFGSTVALDQDLGWTTAVAAASTEHLVIGTEESGRAHVHQGALVQALLP